MMAAIAPFVIIGLFAFMIFGKDRFPKCSRAVSLILLLGVNVTFVVFAASVWKKYDSPALGVFLLGGWAIFQKWCYDVAPPGRRYRWVIIMERAATTLETAAFQPDRYFRLKRSRGWRQLELEIDDAIDIPDAAIIPVVDLGGGTFQNKGGVYVQVGGWISVYFEYKEQVFYGSMRL